MSIIYPDAQEIKETARIYVREFVSWCGKNLTFNDPILDLGCGYRNNRPEIDPASKREFLTLDLNADLHPDIVADAANTGLDKCKFGCVLCTELLEHVVDPSVIIKEIDRLLIPGGLAIITVPFWVPIHEKPWQEDYWRFTPRSLDLLLKKYFQDINITTREEGVFPIDVQAYARKSNGHSC